MDYLPGMCVRFFLLHARGYVTIARVELDKIYCADSRTMREVDDGSVQLIVTSPPYNVGKDYTTHYDEMALEEYLGYLKLIWQECARVLVPGGRIAVNIANTWRKPYVPLNTYIAKQLIDLGLLMRGEIIWDKGPCLSGNTKFFVRDRETGSVSCRRLSDLHDYDTWHKVDIEAVDQAGRPCWQPIVNLWETKHLSGRVLTFSDGSAVTATANHRFPRPDGTLVLAKNLHVGDCLKRSRATPEYEGTIPLAFASESLAWALGLYLAEGSINHRNGRGVSSISYTLHKDEIKFVERLEQVWSSFGCAVNYRIVENKIKANISGQIAYVIIREFIAGTSARTKLPLDSVLRAPREWRAAFLQGWLDGDGHFDALNNCWEGNTTGANLRFMPVMRALTRSLGYRLHHSAGWATADETGKRYQVIRWKLYLAESSHHNAMNWDTIQIKEISERKARFFDVELAHAPHLFVLANGIVSHNSAGISTAWGSFARASNPTLRDVHEYILVFCKETWKLQVTHGNESGIENLEFVEWTKSVWRSPHEEIADAQNSIWQFDTHSRRRNKHAPAHPAPFPLDLPLRLILLYTNMGDVVLDPFVGSGTTALAAKMTQRHYVGYEITPEYCTMAEERIANLGQPRIVEERIARKRKTKQVDK
ncbi:MAG: hypothetical protein HY868_00115 [Chloroflexi bacterium]|nr:hypothetical protein [Chloroflexota bacterium]